MSKENYLIEEKLKIIFIKNIIDATTEFTYATKSIEKKFQLIIHTAETKVKTLKDAEIITNHFLSVFNTFRESIESSTKTFIISHKAWEENCLNNDSHAIETLASEDENCLKRNSPKLRPEENVIEVEDSGSDLEILNEDVRKVNNEDIKIVNEVKYRKSKKDVQNEESEKRENNIAISAIKGETPHVLESITELEGLHIKSDIQGVQLGKEEYNPLPNSDTLHDKTLRYETVNNKNSKGVLNETIEPYHETSSTSNSEKNSESSEDSDESNDPQKIDKNKLNIFVKQIDLNQNKYFLSDRKLQMKCTVELCRHTSQKFVDECQSVYKPKQTVDKFLRAIDLSRLEKKRKTKECSSNSSSNRNSDSEIRKEKKKSIKKPRLGSSESEAESFYASSNSDYEKENHPNIESELNESSKEVDQYERENMRNLLENVSSEDSEDTDDETSDYSSQEIKTKEKRTENESTNSELSNTEDEEDVYHRSKWLEDDILNFKLSDSETKKKKKSQIYTSSSESLGENIDCINTKRKKRRKKRSDPGVSTNGKGSRECPSESSNSSNAFSSNVNDGDLIESENIQIINKDNETSNSIIQDNHLQNHPKFGKVLGRRNIRKVLEDGKIAEVTKQAVRDEESRLQRLSKHTEMLESLYKSKIVENSDTNNILVLDYNEARDKVLVSVDQGLVKHLKPHQKEGVQFMWNSCFETLERTNSTEGSGCILAHCMGLGKTFQVITLVHTLLSNSAIKIQTVMVVCPMSTILNWVDEFHMWLDWVHQKKDICIYQLTQTKTTSKRIAKLNSWYQKGGVLIISYNMFRSFVSEKNKKINPNDADKMKHYLMNPGADLVVCDEGHLLKNEESLLAEKIQCVRTKRKIILTGTPLQNNLKEYHCMVQIVKSNLLGTIEEFQNRFSNPITNGQFENSTPKDVKLMKHRAHVLHKMLEGCVQRCDYRVLTPFLPRKYEYVILIKLSELQIQMYKDLIANVIEMNTMESNFLKNYTEIELLLAHPWILQLKHDGQKYQTKISEFRKNSCVLKDRSGSLKTQEKNASPKNFWWSKFMENQHIRSIDVSLKLIFLFGILEKCEQEGDKLLVFSQSLNTLDMIQYYLQRMKETSKPKEHSFNFQGKWEFGHDYFVLHGGTECDKRNKLCKAFNDANNKRARLFLISTKTGGLGINLIGANRVIIFEPSWNPSNDDQSIARVFRFGQSKPCYIYRFLTAGTMEQKIYNRVVNKLSLSLRVVDEKQISRHYRDSELSDLYKLELNTDEPIVNRPNDHLLADVYLKYKNIVYNIFEHDSLLKNKEDEELDEEERKQAWQDYEQEKEQQQNDAIKKARINLKKRMEVNGIKPEAIVDSSMNGISNSDSISVDSPGIIADNTPSVNAINDQQLNSETINVIES